MKKIVIFTLCSLFLLAGSLTCHASEKQPAVIIDGNAVTFDASTGFPYITDSGRTMIPLRACLNSIGCEVNWNQQTQTVISTKNGVQVQIPLGKNYIFKDQAIISMDTAAVVRDGRTYLPLRSVMASYGYVVNWDSQTGTISVTSGATSDSLSDSYVNLLPSDINGGSTGIFSRKQFGFKGFDGIEADITLPKVSIAEKGDCPYVYFGFDWQNDVGNTEAGFQFIEDSANPNYNKWTVYLRQGNYWGWGNPVYLEQGSTHKLKFYSEKTSEIQVDLVVELDGLEIIRKASSVTEFSNTSVKAVTAMAMSKPFDGINCMSKSEHSKIANMKVSMVDSNDYSDYNSFDLYRERRSSSATEGIWFGTVDCTPSYLHYNLDGSISIYKEP